MTQRPVLLFRHTFFFCRIRKMYWRRSSSSVGTTDYPTTKTWVTFWSSGFPPCRDISEMWKKVSTGHRHHWQRSCYRSICSLFAQPRIFNLEKQKCEYCDQKLFCASVTTLSRFGWFSAPRLRVYSSVTATSVPINLICLMVSSWSSGDQLYSMCAAL